MMECHMGELSPVESAFLLIGLCLLLAFLLVWACHDAERPPPPSYIRDLVLRGRARTRKS
jgi:hypothetical protein